MKTLVKIIHKGELDSEEHGYICITDCPPDKFWWFKDNFNWIKNPETNRTYKFKYIATGEVLQWYPVLEDFEILEEIEDETFDSDSRE